MQNEDKLIKQATDSSFVTEILTDDTPSIVIVSAGWSTQHKMMKQTISNCALTYKDRVKTFVADIEHSNQLTGPYPVTTLPLYLSIKDGQIISRVAGVLPKPKLEALFESVLE